MSNNRKSEEAVESSESEEDIEASSEESGSLESGSDSDSEPEQTQVTTNKSSLSTPAMAISKPQPSSSSSDEEESGSESESDSDGPDTNLRPIAATKPVEDPHKTTATPTSRSIASELVTPARSKRPVGDKEKEETDAKKAKKKKPEEPEASDKKSKDDSKKILFQRIWSEDDEIVILKGLIDYASKKKSDPIADLTAFHQFIKKNLQVDVNRTQLQDKIRRLRKKYMNNKKKEKEGKDRTFSKRHEQRVYELSVRIWRNQSGSENGAADKSNAHEVDVVKDAVVNGDVERVRSASSLNFNGGGVEECILRIGEDVFAAGKGAQGEKEWKELKLEEMELFQKHLKLRTSQVKLVLDYLNTN